MITKRKVILITEKKYQTFLERFEALKFVSEVKEVQEIWNNNKTPIATQTIDDFIDYDYIVPPNELLKIESVREFIEFCHEAGFECGEYQTGELFDTYKSQYQNYQKRENKIYQFR